MQSTIYTARFTPGLSRSSSAASVSSIDTYSAFDDDHLLGLGVATYVPNIPLPFDRDDPPRRTRKRFSSTQLMMLEHLYHQTSHPTREQREVLAREANIELRSVTVWFQNKRQTERKVALSAAPNGNANATSHSSAADRDATPRRGHHPPPTVTLSASSTRTVRTYSQPVLSISHGHSHSFSRHSHSASIEIEHDKHRRPSLDHIASRSEQRTPTRPPLALSLSLPSLSMPSFGSMSHFMQKEGPSLNRSTSVAELWANTPSSPMSSPPSPTSHDRDRELLDFMVARDAERRVRPTLEYACAAARVSGRSMMEDEDDDVLTGPGVSIMASRKTASVGGRSGATKSRSKTKGASTTTKTRTRARRGDDAMDVDTPLGPDDDRMLVSDVGGDTETETETGVQKSSKTRTRTRTRRPASSRRRPVPIPTYDDDRSSNDFDDDNDNDEDDAHEAVTPHSSQDSISGGRNGRTRSRRLAPRVRIEEQGSVGSIDVGIRSGAQRRDDETMDAALALCGLAGL